jgi:hypothetical protein
MPDFPDPLPSDRMGWPGIWLGTMAAIFVIGCVVWLLRDWVGAS